MPTKTGKMRSAILEDLLAGGRRLSRSSLLFRDAVAEAAGLHVTDAECIDFLLEAGEATAGRLAEAAGLTTGAMTAAIDRLEHAGYVRRHRDENDRRKVVVRPVMSRIRPFIPLYESMAAEVMRMYENYSDRELRIILSHNQSLAKIYEREAEKIRGRPR